MFSTVRGLRALIMYDDSRKLNPPQPGPYVIGLRYGRMYRHFGMLPPVPNSAVSG